MKNKLVISTILGVVFITLLYIFGRGEGCPELSYENLLAHPEITCWKFNFNILDYFALGVIVVGILIILILFILIVIPAYKVASPCKTKTNVEEIYEQKEPINIILETSKRNAKKLKNWVDELMKEVAFVDRSCIPEVEKRGTKVIFRFSSEDKARRFWSFLHYNLVYNMPCRVEVYRE